MKRILRSKTQLVTILFALVLAGCDDVPPPVPFSSPTGTVGFAIGPDLAVGRYLHASVALPDGRVVVTGGFVETGKDAERSVEIFTPAANLWASARPMHDARFAHQLVLLPDGRILAMGGQNINLYSLRGELIDIQKPLTEWTITKPMHWPRVHFTATTTTKNTVLVVGGTGDVAPDTEWFDATDDKWLPADKPTALSQSRAYHESVCLQNGAVLVVGGLSLKEGAYLDVAEVFDPATETWNATGSMRAPRAAFTLTLLRNGLVIAVGGTTSDKSALKSAEVFDPKLGSWTEIESMAQGRTGHQATLLMGGRRLLVTGGSDADAKPIATAEMLDIETMQWTSAGTLVAPRFFHSAHLVASDGRVLLVGGVDGPINGKPPTVVKTELFTPPCASNLECAAGYYCALEGVCAAFAH